MFRIIFSLAALLAALPVAQADILKIDNGKPVVVVLENRPHRGMTMDEVRQQFGEPMESRGPVGDPPITTWNYGDFIVVFVNKTARKP